MLTEKLVHEVMAVAACQKDILWVQMVDAKIVVVRGIDDKYLVLFAQWAGSLLTVMGGYGLPVGGSQKYIVVKSASQFSNRATKLPDTQWSQIGTQLVKPVGWWKLTGQDIGCQYFKLIGR